MKKHSVILSLFALLFIFTLLTPYPGNAQRKGSIPHDSSYYVTYPEKITPRFYFSKKYTTLTLQAPASIKDIQYRPNTKLTMGIGATYHNISLNLGYGFGFLNHDEEKGKTRYIDLQAHFYRPNWVVDLFGQFYKGFYIYPKGYASANPENYYQRPDAIINHVGVAAYRLSNAKRFSYRAAMIQNEWQKKSAGTLLFGGEIHYGIMKADSAWVPSVNKGNHPQADISEIRFYSIGPGAGYAYTLVVKQHFFVMGSLVLNFDLALTDETGTSGKHSKTAINPGGLFKAAAGYNSSSWDVSANWVGNNLRVQGASSSNKYLLNTGNYRFILAKKITYRKRH